MFGLEEAEVMDRRRYVGHVRHEIEVRSWKLHLIAALNIYAANIQTFVL